jgi:hypothetical protein
MAYVGDYEYDIFISYPMEAEAWTRRFATDLLDGTELPAAIAPCIYFAGKDWRLGGTSDNMLEAAPKSALFVAVLTRDALSEHHKRFLTKEMDNFQKSGPIKDRFCPIPLHPINSSQLKEAIPTKNPEAFWNTNLTFFYDEGDGIPLRLKPDSEPKPGEYSKRVQKVAHQLRELLEKLRSSRSDEARINSHGPFAGTTVFLARKDTETYIESEWLTVRNTLLSDGSTVVPALERNDGSRDTDAELLGRADLFIQLFHGLDRLEDAKAQLKAAEAEAEFRKSQTGKLLPILRWRKKHFNATADTNFLRNLLEEDQKFCQSAQTGTLEEFKLAISDKLQELRNPPHPPPPPDPQPYLYITADKFDRDLAIKIQARAREHTLADVMTRDETRQRHDFIEGLTRASGIIFLYGNAEARFIEA